MNTNVGDIPILLSEVDTRRFGIRVARWPHASREDLAETLQHCRERDVELLIARCPAEDYETVHALERGGFLLMDTLILSRRNLARQPIPGELKKHTVRPLVPGEEETVREVAADSFDDYAGHYRNDERLDRKESLASYPDLAYRACISKEVADEVLVAELDGSVVGFMAMRMNKPNEGEPFLAGVAKEGQMRGVIQSLMVAGMEWCVERGARYMVTSTALTNAAAQRILAQFNFKFRSASHTFHKWFDEFN